MLIAMNEVNRSKKGFNMGTVLQVEMTLEQVEKFLYFEKNWTLL